jgi:hypothetical protein
MRARRVPVADVPAGSVAAAHHNVGLALFQIVEHLRQQSLIVLHVGIDHRQVRCGSREHSFDTSGGQSAAANSLQAPDAAIRHCEFPQQLGGTIR